MISLQYARLLRRLIEKAAASLTDEDALSGVELYAEWKPGVDYSVGDRRRDGNVLYKCVQSHTSQSDWRPSVTPALWVVVSLDEYPEWIQPTGVQDAYPLGAKVTHNEKHWVSQVNDNVWEPGVYGWEEVE